MVGVVAADAGWQRARGRRRTGGEREGVRDQWVPRQRLKFFGSVDFELFFFLCVFSLSYSLFFLELYRSVLFHTENILCLETQTVKCALKLRDNLKERRRGLGSLSIACSLLPLSLFFLSSLSFSRRCAAVSAVDMLTLTETASRTLGSLFFAKSARTVAAALSRSFINFSPLLSCLSLPP